jgi:imidazolonepropionase-like amidohydrolase
VIRSFQVSGRLIVGVMVVWALLSSSASAQLASTPDAGAGTVVIRGGWLWNGLADDRVRNTGLVIDNRKFVEIGANLAGRDLTGARVIDLADNQTIVPGMFDLHAHYNLDLVGGGRTDEANYMGVIWLANGITSTFPAGEYDPDRMLAARRRIDAGTQIGARIFSSGPYWGTGRCEDANSSKDTCAAWPADITPEQMRAQVDYWAERGMKSLKLKQATPEQMRILIEHAHRRGLTTTSHLQMENFRLEVHPRDAILMGLDRIEHSIAAVEEIVLERIKVGDPALTELFDLVIKRNVYIDPTIRQYCGPTFARMKVAQPWTDEERFFTPYVQERMKRLRAERQRQPAPGPLPLRDYDRFCTHKLPELKAFYDHGGGHLITIGTDAPNFLGGFAYHRDLEAHANVVGLPPVAVMREATINGARALRVDDILGSIEVGKLADLVILDGNPLQRIQDSRNVHTVVKAGEVFDAPALLKRVEGKIGPVTKGEESAWRWAGPWMMDEAKP